MHELGIADSILDAVRAEAAKRPGVRVAKVCVRVGALSGVVPDALSFGFECLVQGTDLEPLALVIENVPRRQRCPHCDFTFEVTKNRGETANTTSAGLPNGDFGPRTSDSGLDLRIPDFGVDLSCPRCGSTDTQLAGGDQLELAYLEVEGSDK